MVLKTNIKRYLLLIGAITVISSCSSVNKLSNPELSLIGTTWYYQDNRHDWKYELTFLENGYIKTTHPNDFTPKNDVWKQNGTLLEFRFNDGYSVYNGKIKSLNKITGKAKNTNGIKWKWKLTKR